MHAQAPSFLRAEVFSRSCISTLSLGMVLIPKCLSTASCSGTTCVGDVYDELGERTGPALKQFQRIYVGSQICEMSTPECDTATTK